MPNKRPSTGKASTGKGLDDADDVDDKIQNFSKRRPKMSESCSCCGSMGSESEIAEALRDSFTTREFATVGNLTEAMMYIAHQLGKIAQALGYSEDR
jgi:hypothetical protein